MHQVARGCELAASMRQPGPKERQFRPGKSWVGGQSVEAVLGLAGRAVRFGLDQLTAALADAGLAAELAIDEGAPLLIGRNWVRDDDGGVIEYGEYTAVTGQWQSYEYGLE